MKIQTYKKHNSFSAFETKEKDNKSLIIKKIIELKTKKVGLENLSIDFKKILEKVILDLTVEQKDIDNNKIFKLEKNVLAEISTMDDKDWLRYLVHRYRYEIYPITNKIDDYPPCLQIEPSSICNYRCVFCFETDKTFTNKKNGHMGTMDIDLFKKIIDDAENRIEFITLASRGEPLVSKRIDEMLNYTKGKMKKNVTQYFLVE